MSNRENASEVVKILAQVIASTQDATMQLHRAAELAEPGTRPHEDLKELQAALKVIRKGLADPARYWTSESLMNKPSTYTITTGEPEAVSFNDTPGIHWH